MSCSTRGEHASGSVKMNSVIRLCPKCGGEIPADAPEGGCPGCLLESGLGLFEVAFVAGVDSSAVASAKADDPGHVDTLARDDVTSFPHWKNAARAATMPGEVGADV